MLLFACFYLMSIRTLLEAFMEYLKSKLVRLLCQITRHFNAGVTL